MILVNFRLLFILNISSHIDRDSSGAMQGVNNAINAAINALVIAVYSGRNSSIYSLPRHGTQTISYKL